ncbi:LuxR C-terminal-related transcriptional regulator [Rhodococcus sp. IEGM 1379]|uniref:helix-turn-helix transcriptional regulator n=1 Tax=Rhodococcus sp. IEGM 1379 TaxID=3047086 RepID=UPI0024B76EE6|nr:LuxR C-terminal-related transcriptional regulator [Rhodococcus sp. IEGM 1379]MDI9913964.1 LuxR C-terminal-related transcriptional regulator [Rhodococcus sp. IEGM 1379]
MTHRDVLVGRERELAALGRALSTAQAGSPTLVLIEGDAGSGKSTLVNRFIDMAAHHTLLHARGLEWESQTPFGVAQQLLERPVSIAAPVPVANEILASSDGLTFVVVDDAHHSDVESLQAITSALHRGRDTPLLIILVAEESPRLSMEVSHILELHWAQRLHIRPLDASEIVEIAQVRNGIDLGSGAARQLQEFTAGNTLDVVSLLDELPPSQWSHWHRTLPLPRHRAASIAHDLAACSDEARTLVEAAAVLGNNTTLSHLSLLAEVRDIVEALDSAFASGLLTIHEQRGSTEVSFRGPMIAAAVSATLGPARLHQLHLRAADIAWGDGERLFHLAAASTTHDERLASDLVTYAALRAAEGAWSEVADALVTASSLTTDQSKHEDRLLRGVDALTGSGDIPRAMVFAPEIESITRNPLRDAVLGYLSIHRGRPTEAADLLTRAWSSCRADLEPATSALIAQRMVLHSLATLDGTALVEWVDRAVELVGPTDPAAVESEAIKGLGLGATGQVDQALAAYEELSDRIRPGAQAQRFQMGRGWLELALDHPEAARRDLETAVSTEFSSGSARISLWAQAWLARTQFALGAWDEALTTVESAGAELDRFEIEIVRPLIHWSGAQIHALRGNWDLARDHVRRAYAGTHAYEIMYVPSLLARAQFAEAAADYPDVLLALAPLTSSSAQQWLDEPGFWPWVDLYANALVMVGRVDDADAFLRPHERTALKRRHRSATARLGYVRGRIHGARGELDAARQCFDEALLSIVELPLPYDRARINFAYGQTLRRAGKRGDADVVLRAARALYLALGAGTYVERCDRELRAGGLNPSRTDKGITDLTPQERAVVDLVAAGKSNKEAASELFLSVKTIQYHLTRAYAKLGLRSRSELAAFFRERGLSDPHQEN